MLKSVQNQKKNTITMEQKTFNVDKLCRACMTETDDKKTLFQNNNENNVKLSDMLSYCTSLQILDSDGLPNQICTVCELQLNSAYLFRKKCLVSDVELREKLGLSEESVAIKQEVDEEVYIYIYMIYKIK